MVAISEHKGKIAMGVMALGVGLVWGRKWERLGSALFLGGAAAGLYILNSNHAAEKQKIKEEHAENQEKLKANTEALQSKAQIAEQEAKTVESIKAQLGSWNENQPSQEQIQNKVAELLKDGPLSLGVLKGLSKDIHTYWEATAFVNCLVSAEVWDMEKMALGAEKFADPSYAIQTAIYCQKWECKEPISLKAYLLISNHKSRETLEYDKRVTLDSLASCAQIIYYNQNAEILRENCLTVGWKAWVELARDYFITSKGNLDGWTGPNLAANVCQSVGTRAKAYDSAAIPAEPFSGGQ